MRWDKSNAWGESIHMQVCSEREGRKVFASSELESREPRVSFGLEAGSLKLSFELASRGLMVLFGLEAGSLSVSFKQETRAREVWFEPEAREPLAGGGASLSEHNHR